jgi:prepilin-type N-terminal cleavage/methylation domain-containing protein
LLKYKQSKESGFTLIEIMVVLVILAILMTISFVFLGDQGKRARLATATASVKSSMTIAATCQVMGGTGAVQAPPDDSRGPGNAICSGVSTIPDTSVWPKLPEKCLYCGRDGTKINFECQNKACADISTKSFCDYNNTQCVQNE